MKRQGLIRRVFDTQATLKDHRLLWGSFDVLPDNVEKKNRSVGHSLDFLKKRQYGNELTPEEEGELSGLLVHPDNESAQLLVKKEYLAFLGLSSMSEEECRQLQGIRAEQSLQKAGEIPFPLSLHDIISIRVLHNVARIASLFQESWGNKPKEVIESIAESADEMKIHNRTVEGLAKDQEIFPMELYFLSKLSFWDLDSITRSTGKEPKGSFSAIASIKCMRDRIRTKKFILAIRNAIQQLESSGNEEILVCDAGCGAIPVLAIYAALCSEKVRCTALELNPESAELARRLVRKLNLQDRIQIVEADATNFQLGKDIDLLISETMHSGLTSEPLVQIMTNLSKYVKSGGIILPTKITVKAALVRLEEWRNSEQYVQISSKIYSHVKPEWQTVVNYEPGDSLHEIEFSIPINELAPGNYIGLIASEVDIYNEHLGLYESLITIPRRILDSEENVCTFLIAENITSKSVKIKYRPGEVLIGRLDQSNSDTGITYTWQTIDPEVAFEERISKVESLFEMDGSYNHLNVVAVKPTYRTIKL